MNHVIAFSEVQVQIKFPYDWSTKNVSVANTPYLSQVLKELKMVDHLHGWRPEKVVQTCV